MTRLQVVPLTLAQANDLVARWHRHHRPVVGHRFSLGMLDDGELVGAVIVGRPVARAVEQYHVAEVTRLVTNGSHNACSFLYSAAARVAKAMGFTKIQTYILETELGTSLKASGWHYEETTAGGDWNHSKANAGTRRVDQPQGPKQRWVRELSC